MPYDFATSPAAKEAQRELSKQTVVSVTAPIQFDQPTTIKEVRAVPERPNLRHLELSYLRSAYLLVFSHLGRAGYVYAQSDAVRLLRAQMLNPNDEVCPGLVRAFTSKRAIGNVITLRRNEMPFFWSVRFDDGACVFLPHGGSKNNLWQIAKLPEAQRISGWEWEPQKFGNVYVDRRRLLRQHELGDGGLFGREYVTVSNGGCEQRWIVVNQVGDAMHAGPKTWPSDRPPAVRVAAVAVGPLHRPGCS